MGDLTGQSGPGADGRDRDPVASATTRPGDMLTAATTSTAGSGQPSNATSETFTYNDRGLLLTAAGAAGSSAYT